MDALRDERGVVAAWLVKILLIIVVVGVVVFDAVTMAVNFLGLDSATEDAAVALSRVAASGPDGGTVRCRAGSPGGLPLCREAQELAARAGARLLLAEVNADGVVRIKMRRAAKTLVVRRISPAKKWSVATAEAEATST